METLIILYLLISLVWLIISIIVNMIYERRFIWTVIFIALTILYVPIALWYARQGREDRVKNIVLITIVWIVLYLIIEGAFAVSFLSTRLRVSE